ncbi:hypothetical protein QQ045_032806 [Rhodiola kirilowii]
MFALLLSSAIRAFYEPADELKKDTRFWCLMFLGLGVINLLALTAKSYLLAVAGCKLVNRIRSKCFEKAISMEISWFDKVENSSGAIGARLSADAASIRCLVGGGWAEINYSSTSRPPLCAECANYSNYSQDDYLDKLWVRGKHISDAHWRESVNERDGPLADDQDQHGHDVDPSHYFWLYKAASIGDWESYKWLCDRYADAKTARIGRKSETALMVAVGNGSKTAKFVEKLLNISTPSDLEMTDKDGRTALGIAAMVGNMEAAKLLVQKNPSLPNISSGCAAGFPIHCAAEYGHKNLLLYLLDVTTTRAYLNPFGRYCYGKKLISDALKAEFYDVATKLMEYHVGDLTWGVIKGLNLLAENPSAFSYGREANFLKWFVEKCMPPENNIQVDSSQTSSKSSLLHSLLWKFCGKLVPPLKQAEERLHKYRHAVCLVARYFQTTLNGPNFGGDSVHNKFKLPMLLAATNGIHEIIETVTKGFPDAMWFYDDKQSDIFRLAISNRHHNVYNLLYEMGDLYINIVRQSVDEKGDSMLHWAAYSAPPQRLNHISGAASQMQHEVQWYKEIENLVPLTFRDLRNVAGLTPRDVFLESHQKLMAEAERWMKDTSNSCTISAALITTIVFAAAITVPGGNSGENGVPMFARNKAFIIFGVADALSLFTSSISILMFLSILTSRYAEQDFLYALPKRLIIGLVALFVSIASMMMAFSATLYLVFGAHKRWILTSVVASSSLPVAIFASLQFSLLYEMISSTYGPGLFKRPKTSISTDHGYRENELQKFRKNLEDYKATCMP